MNGTYVHRQRGLLWLACVVPGTLNVVLAVYLEGDAAGDPGGEAPIWNRATLAVAAVLFLFLALCFVWLESRDDGDALHVRFGPLPVFSLRVPYTDVATAARGQSAIIDGWGIHYIPGRGWTWNLSGRDCVELGLTSGKRIRIGTDDPDGLLDAVLASTGLPRQIERTAGGRDAS